MAICIYNIRWVSNRLAFIDNMNRQQHNYYYSSQLLSHVRSRFLHPLLLHAWAVQFSCPELPRTAEVDSFTFSEEKIIPLLMYSVQPGGATSLCTLRYYHLKKPQCFSLSWWSHFWPLKFADQTYSWQAHNTFVLMLALLFSSNQPDSLVLYKGEQAKFS